MLTRRTGLGVFLVFGFLMMVGSALAQQGRTGDKVPARVPQPQSPRDPKTNRLHKFWDLENISLFTGTAVARGLDYTSTQHFRQRDVNEVLLTNGIVDNKPLFAGIEAAGDAASVGISYWLHHAGHHRAERWVSIVHIGVATFGDIRNYGLSNPQKLGLLH